jgi:hypothetical protein
VYNRSYQKKDDYLANLQKGAQKWLQKRVQRPFLCWRFSQGSSSVQQPHEEAIRAQVQPDQSVHVRPHAVHIADPAAQSIMARTGAVTAACIAVRA